jgi:hypothetical protein
MISVISPYYTVINYPIQLSPGSQIMSDGPLHSGMHSPDAECHVVLGVQMVVGKKLKEK